MVSCDNCYNWRSPFRVSLNCDLSVIPSLLYLLSNIILFWDLYFHVIYTQFYHVSNVNYFTCALSPLHTPHVCILLHLSYLPIVTLSCCKLYNVSFMCHLSEHFSLIDVSVMNVMNAWLHSIEMFHKMQHKKKQSLINFRLMHLIDIWKTAAHRML